MVTCSRSFDCGIFRPHSTILRLGSLWRANHEGEMWLIVVLLALFGNACNLAPPLARKTKIAARRTIFAHSLWISQESYT